MSKLQRLLNLPKLHIQILLLLTIFVLSFAYFSFDGFHFYDDTGYIEKAHFLRTNTWENIFKNPNEQAHRFSFLLPLAILQNYLPFTEFTHIIWITICTLFGIYLVYACLANDAENIALYASLLIGLDYYYLYLSNKVYPDTQTAICCLFSAFILQKIVVNSTQKKTMAMALLFVLAMAAALLAKLTAIFILPFYLFVFLQHFVGIFPYHLTNSSQNKAPKSNFFLQTFVFACLGLCGYLLVYQYFTGDFLFRFRAVENNRYADALSYFDKSWKIMAIRLTYEPILMFLKAGYFVNFCLAIPIIVQILRKNRAMYAQKTVVYWTHLLLFLLVFYWFGTTSLQVYSPLPLDYRMFVLLSPFLAMVAAFGFRESLRNSAYQIFYFVAFALAAYSTKVYLYSPNYLIYSLLALVFGLMWLSNLQIVLQIRQDSFQVFKIWKLLFFLVLTIHPIYTIWHSDSKNYFAEKYILQEFLPKYLASNPQKIPNQKILIYTDSRLAESFLFYYNFVQIPTMSFLSFENLQTIAPVPTTRQYVLYNHQTVNYLQAYTGKKTTVLLENLGKNAKILWVGEKVVLYELYYCL